MPLFKVWSEGKLNKKFVVAENFAELASRVPLTCLEGGAFDHVNWQHSGEFDQNFSKKSNAPGFAPGGGGGRWAVLELTGTLFRSNSLVAVYLWSFVSILLYIYSIKVQNPNFGTSANHNNNYSNNNKS